MTHDLESHPATQSSPSTASAECYLISKPAGSSPDRRTLQTASLPDSARLDVAAESTVSPPSPPPSPTFGSDGEEHLPGGRDVIISPVPRLRQTHSTAGYRDGVAAAKTTHVQAGFDKGYGVGARAGLRVGAVVGVLEGLVSAGWGGERVEAVLGRARRELGVEHVFEGIHAEAGLGRDGDALLSRWEALVKDEGNKCGVEVSLGRHEGAQDGAEMAPSDETDNT